MRRNERLGRGRTDVGALVGTLRSSPAHARTGMCNKALHSLSAPVLLWAGRGVAWRGGERGGARTTCATMGVYKSPDILHHAWSYLPTGGNNKAQPQRSHGGFNFPGAFGGSSSGRAGWLAVSPSGSGHAPVQYLSRLRSSTYLAVRHRALCTIHDMNAPSRAEDNTQARARHGAFSRLATVHGGRVGRCMCMYVHVSTVVQSVPSLDNRAPIYAYLPWALPRAKPYRNRSVRGAEKRRVGI